MEYTVVTVIIALVGLLIAVTTPIIRLNTTVTKLTVTVDHLARQVAELEGNNRTSKAKLWEHNDIQDKQLSDHEARLKVLEEN